MVDQFFCFSCIPWQTMLPVHVNVEEGQVMLLSWFEEVLLQTVNFKTLSFVSPSKHTFRGQLLLPSLHPSAKPLVPSWHVRVSAHWQIRRDPPSLREAISCICSLADLICIPFWVQAGGSRSLFSCAQRLPVYSVSLSCVISRWEKTLTLWLQTKAPPAGCKEANLSLHSVTSFLLL